MRAYSSVSNKYTDSFQFDSKGGEQVSLKWVKCKATIFTFAHTHTQLLAIHLLMLLMRVVVLHTKERGSRRVDREKDNERGKR